MCLSKACLSYSRDSDSVYVNKGKKLLRVEVEEYREVERGQQGS